MTRSGPETMSPEERLAGIAAILAVGYLRLQVSRHSAQNRLDERGPSEAPCAPKVLNPKSSENAA